MSDEPYAAPKSPPSSESALSERSDEAASKTPPPVWLVVIALQLILFVGALFTLWLWLA